MRAFLFVASIAAAASLSSAASAESAATALVRLLHKPGRAHPLADAGGRIPLSILLPPGTDAGALGLLAVAPGVGALRLAPEEVAPFAAAHPGLRIGVAPRFRPLLDVSPQWTRVNVFRAATGLTGQGAIVGVVDTGLDVRHPDFLTKDGHTRVAWLLSAGMPKGLHPDLEAQFGCTDPKQAPCAVYAAADIDAVIKAGSDELGDPEGHGTHVTSIAAGNGGPSVNKTPRFVGQAPEATIIAAAPPNSDGGFVDTDILNAARFVFDRAAQMGRLTSCTQQSGTPTCPPVDCDGQACTPVPVAVNLSLGSDFGAHDGTSAIETGLAAFVGDDKPGRAVVIAAGNSGEVDAPVGAGGPFGIHTEVHVFEGETARVPILANAAATKGSGYVWVNFHPGDDVSVGLEGPGGSTWVSLTGRGSQAGYDSGGNQGGVVNNLPSADSALTADTNGATVVFTGAWAAGSEFAVILRGSGDASLWITAQGDALQGLFFEKALRQGTINVPATAPTLLGVGCTVNRVSWTPLGGKIVGLGSLGDDMNPVADSACYFSSDGPTPAGVQKPEISAPGAFVAAAMSADADPRVNPGGIFDLEGCPTDDPFCALLDDSHALAAGTSMSAPHVTGAAALLMEVDPTLTQARLTEVLQAGARLSHGHIPDPDQLGPGSLDVEGAHQALLDTMAAPAAPDLAVSWYTLSSDYARPDPSWPVWGTVELRKKDLTAAGGIDGSQLALSLQGGAVYQPLTKVRTGLWRFAVAGRPTDLGGSLVVDVTYAGTSIGGPRTLPVGYDAWTAADPAIGATGACACTEAGAQGHGGWSGHAALGLMAIAATGAARRRTRASVTRATLPERRA